MTDACESCGHARASHYRDVDGVARCLHEQRGTSSRGVMGIPWSRRCDCVDFNSPASEHQKEQERKREEERQAVYASIVSEAQRQLAEQAAQRGSADDC